MPTSIFVNLPVANLERSKTFFGSLGFTFNPQFTDDTAACMVVADNIFAMLITHARFRDFTARAIADAHAVTEVLTSLGMESRERVDEIADAALLAGGGQARPPEDLGFMYLRSISDPDGHLWEFFWMDPAHVK